MKEICQGVHKFIDPWWFGLTAIAVPPDPDYPAVPLSGSIDLNTVDPAFYRSGCLGFELEAGWPTGGPGRTLG